MKRLVEVVSNTEHSLEAGDSGLVQIFVSEAALKRRVEKGGEILETNFLFQMLGESLREEVTLTAEARAKSSFVVKTLTRMAMEYRLLQIDAVTEPDELIEYLRLAETLGLVPDANAAAAEIIREFPDANSNLNLGRIEARYVAKVHPSSIKTLFSRFSDTKTDKALTRITRETCNRLMAAHYIGQARQSRFKAKIGFAYRSSRNAKLHDELGFAAFITRGVHASLPPWATGSSNAQTVKLTTEQTTIVSRLFRIEKDLARLVVQLDNAVDNARAGGGAVSDKEVEEAARAFVAKGASTDRFGPKNAFFGIVDRLIGAAEGNKGQRDSALILEITPKDSTDTIRKFLMSGSGEDPL